MDADGHWPVEDGETRILSWTSLGHDSGGASVSVPRRWWFFSSWASLMYLWFCSGMVSSGGLRRSWKNSTHLPRAARAACTWTLGYFSELVSGKHLARCFRASLRLLLEELQSLGVFMPAQFAHGNLDTTSTFPRWLHRFFAQCLARQWVHVPRQLLEASERISIFYYVLR